MFRFHTGSIAQTWSDASHVEASFIVTQFIFTAYKKTNEQVDAAGYCCMAITVIQYFIVVEH